MDLTAVRAQVEHMTAELERIRSGHAELQRALRELSVSVTSADDLVTVTVDARGQVQRVELDTRIYQRPDSRRLAATITATIQQAAAEAMAKVAELTSPFIPDQARRAHLDGDLDAVLAQQEAQRLGR